jgi:hypothetical protein
MLIVLAACAGLEDAERGRHVSCELVPAAPSTVVECHDIDVCCDDRDGSCFWVIEGREYHDANAMQCAACEIGSETAALMGR